MDDWIKGPVIPTRRLIHWWDYGCMCCQDVSSTWDAPRVLQSRPWRAALSGSSFLSAPSCHALQLSSVPPSCSSPACFCLRTTELTMDWTLCNRGPKEIPDPFSCEYWVFCPSNGKCCMQDRKVSAFILIILFYCVTVFYLLCFFSKF